MKYDLDLNNNYILSHTRAFHINDKFEILGAVDSDIEKKKLLKKNYGYDSFNSIKDAFKILKPDGVLISTPPETHLNLINEVLKHNNTINFIVCEKPFTDSLENATKVSNLCAKKNIRIFVNYQRNSSIVTKKILYDIENDKIKPPFNVTHWYSDGLENSCSHFIALFNQLFGKVKTIGKVQRNILNKKTDFFLNYKDAQVYFSELEYPYAFNGFKMFCQNGVLEYLNNGINIKWNNLIYTEIKYPKKQIVSNQNKFYNNDFFQSQMSFTDQLYKSLINEKSVISSDKDAIYVRRILKKVKKINE